MSTIKEFQRLREDFESRASEYHDLSLFVFFITNKRPSEDIIFKKPNHNISLWQYLGDISSDAIPKRIENIIHTPFGLVGAELSCFGVVEGKETELFVRMANRAGSLIPQETVIGITENVMNNVIDEKKNGMPVFVCNPNPLSVWLNLMLTLIQKNQPSRFRNQRLTVDLFTASLAAVDYIIEDINRMSSPPATSSKDKAKRFRVALSFPGEKRDFVESVADYLADKITKSKVFYDNFHKAELATTDLDIILQSIYQKDSDLVVVFLCKEYEQKEWCGLELRAIRNMIKQRRNNEIMFFRFDHAEIPGLLSIDGHIYIDMNLHGPKEVGDFILERLEAI